MVVLDIIVAAWFSQLPEWTTWILLVALGLYDLAAVLAPGGLLKLLVELASSRDEELPALVYECRPNVGRNSGARVSNLGFFVAAGVGMSSDDNTSNSNNHNGSVELQELLRNGDRDTAIEIQESEHLAIAIDESDRTSGGEIEEVREEAGEMAPLMEIAIQLKGGLIQMVVVAILVVWTIVGCHDELSKKGLKWRTSILGG